MSEQPGLKREGTMAVTAQVNHVYLVCIWGVFDLANPGQIFKN